MKIKIISSLFFFVSLLSIPTAYAGEAISVTQAWARPVILQNRPGAAYMTLTNDSDQEDRLVKASSPQAERIELHVHRHQDGVMKMEQVAYIPIAAHATTEIKPGGYHLMLFGLSKKFAVGDMVPLTLTFAHGGTVDLNVQVMKKAPMKMDHGSAMDH
ncbi:copper chaperone PCu(A)C [Paremcibacter congregatus]|uniref:copper chaperone PCu(A)C n=1 Tax=Paremcibacter congregatus TaxID=2043170 RepID=UPI0030EEDEC5